MLHKWVEKKKCSMPDLGISLQKLMSPADSMKTLYTPGDSKILWMSESNPLAHRFMTRATGFGVSNNVQWKLYCSQPHLPLTCKCGETVVARWQELGTVARIEDSGKERNGVRFTSEFWSWLTSGREQKINSLRHLVASKEVPNLASWTSKFMQVADYRPKLFWQVMGIHASKVKSICIVRAAEIVWSCWWL